MSADSVRIDTFTEAIHAGERTHPKKFSMDFHCHACCEIVYITGGAGWYEKKSDGKSVQYPVKPGNLLFWNGREPHRSVDSSKSELSQIVLTFDPELLKKTGIYTHLYPLLFESEQPLTLTNSLFTRQIAPLLRNITEESSHPSLLAEELKLSILSVILLRVYRYFKEGNAVLPLQENQDNRIEEVLAHLSVHSGTDLNPQMYADSLDISIRRFSTLFKNYTNMTFVNYLNGLRLEKSLELLQSKKCQVANAAFQSGFANLSHFTRLFRRKYHISPGTILKKLS